MQEFILRNNAAQVNKEKKIHKLREEIKEVENEQIERGKVRQSKTSAQIIDRSAKFRQKDLVERQEIFLEEKNKWIQERIKEKEDEELLNSLVFQRVSEVKSYQKRGKHENTARTAEVSRANNSDRSHSPFLDNDFSKTKSIGTPATPSLLGFRRAQKKAKDLSSNRGDFSRVLIDDDYSPICFELHADEEGLIPNVEVKDIQSPPVRKQSAARPINHSRGMQRSSRDSSKQKSNESIYKLARNSNSGSRNNSAKFKDSPVGRVSHFDSNHISSNRPMPPTPTPSPFEAT